MPTKLCIHDRSSGVTLKAESSRELSMIFRIPCSLVSEKPITDTAEENKTKLEQISDKLTFVTHLGNTQHLNHTRHRQLGHPKVLTNFVASHKTLTSGQYGLRRDLE